MAIIEKQPNDRPAEQIYASYVQTIDYEVYDECGKMSNNQWIDKQVALFCLCVCL